MLLKDLNQKVHWYSKKGWFFMQKNKRLRIFAGPNGSGKSTLFKEFKTLYNPGNFINADELEKSLSNSGLIDLTEIGLKATQKD